MKQAVVQRPKPKVEGRCLINLKSHEKETLKKQVVDPEPMDDGVTSAFIDDEDDATPAPETVFKTGGGGAVATSASVAVEEPVSAAAAVPKVVKKVVKKKVDA